MQFSRFAFSMLVGAGVASSVAMIPACGTAQTVANETGVISGSGALLTVEGLGCPMCAESIHVLLDNVEGVADSDVNLETGIVDVSFVSGASVSRAALASAVVDGGFSLRNIQAKE